MDDIHKVVIDDGVLKGESEPLLMYEKSDKAAASD